MILFWTKFEKICHSALRLHSRAITGEVPFPKGLLVVCLPLSKSLSVQVKAIKVFIKIPFSYLQLDLLTIQVNNWVFFSIIEKKRSLLKASCFFVKNSCRNSISFFDKFLSWKVESESKMRQHPFALVFFISKISFNYLLQLGQVNNRVFFQ